MPHLINDTICQLKSVSNGYPLFFVCFLTSVLSKQFGHDWNDRSELGEKYWRFLTISGIHVNCMSLLLKQKSPDLLTSSYKWFYKTCFCTVERRKSDGILGFWSYSQYTLCSLLTYTLNMIQITGILQKKLKIRKANNLDVFYLI